MSMRHIIMSMRWFKKKKKKKKKKLNIETHRIKSIYPQQINSIILNQLNKVSSDEMGNNQSNKPKSQTYLNTQTHIWSKSQTTPNP